MKKISFALLLFVASTVILPMQGKSQASGSGLYVKLFGGYGLGTQLADGVTTRTTSGSATIDQYTKVAYGTGINAGLSIGTSISDHLGFELTGNYFIGSNIKVNNVTSSNLVQKTDQNLKMINLIPAVVIKTSNEGGANFYGKFGPSIGFGGKVNEKLENTAIVGPLSSTTVVKFEYNKGMSIGFQTALGLDFPLSDNLSLNAEFTFRDQKFAPQEGRLISATSNGNDFLGSINVRDKQIEFVDEIRSTDNSNANQPRKELKTYYAFSAVGLNVGVRFSF